MLRFFRNRRALVTPRRTYTPAERVELASRLASNSIAFLGLYEGWQYFDGQVANGFVAYERHCGVALACGEPIATPEDVSSLVEEFTAFCEEQGLRPAFASSSRAFAQASSERGWQCLKIGEEPWFDSETYAPRGNSTKKVRSAANQGRNNGVTIEVVDEGCAPSPAAVIAMREVIDEWRSSRKVRALGFTLRLQPMTLAQHKMILFAWQNGRLQAFLTCIPVPARNAASVEDLIRRPSAPNGVSELLLLAAIESCRDRGIARLTLGLAPLRAAATQPFGHRKVGRMLGSVGRHLNIFYDFRALGHFKAKFAPTHWEDSYLVYPPHQLPRCALALAVAFTPGRLGGIQTLFSRWRLRTAYPLLNRAASITSFAAVAAVGAFVAVNTPALTPFVIAERDFVRVAFGVGSQVRHHLYVDAFLAAGLGAAYLRSARSG